tara:strand:+ start:4506 stop:4682 length:177 start_codon:yes stop_codon:yes gene_type:complete
MKIENCKYVRLPDSIEDECIEAEIDGVKCWVPLDPMNTDYAEILKQVKEGSLTIKDAD